ncbi:phosphotransferase [Nonomuraea composti]|uniref:phosphotransferase n=1 Tax=Nonomuraea composti TaxID=2720023 RepID=UPI001980E57E
MTDDGVEVPLAGARGVVSRRGGTVLRAAGPWSATVQALLRHLEEAGFEGAPRVAGSGFEPGSGRETLTFVEGGFVRLGQWSDEAAHALGRLLRDLHTATATFAEPGDATWQPWHGRDLGRRPRVIGHCDTGPWNVVVRGGLPVAFIDWEVAGPVDPLVEVAQLCWLNSHLHDDEVAALAGLRPLAERLHVLRLMIEGYGLADRDRADLVEHMILVAVQDAAALAPVTVAPQTGGDPGPSRSLVHGMAWRLRSAAWMQRHRDVLERAVRT